ncbi:MAG: hypothetical protein QXI19_10455 [Candidatus Caldarchaeum sp.]
MEENKENKTFTGPCPATVLMRALGLKIEIEKCTYRFTGSGTLRISSRLINGFINNPEECLKIYEAIKKNQ